MKKLLAMLLACLMVFSLVACGGGQQPANGGEADKQGEAGKTGNLGPADVFYYTYADTYISSVRAIMDKEWAANGIKFNNFDGAGNATTQNEQISTALNGGSKLLVVNIVNSAAEDAAMNIVNDAKAKEVPVIFFNREVSDNVINAYDKAIFVGTDAAEAGHMQGEMIGKYLVENYDKVDLNKDGKISYVVFKGDEANPEAIYRTKYGVEDADKVLKDAGKPALEYYDAKASVKYMVDPDGQWSAKYGNEFMSQILAQYNEQNKNMVELVICNNDGMAEGAIQALNTAGYNLGKDKPDSITIPVFGVDATDAAKQLIAAGKMTGTIKQDAEGMAKAIVSIAKNLLEGKGMLDGLKLNKDEKVNKIRIPYQIYTGE